MKSFEDKYVRNRYFYLDNAASTRIKTEEYTILTNISHHQNLFANPSSLHSVGRNTKSTMLYYINKVCDSYNKIITYKTPNKDFKTISNGNFIFTSGGSESNNLAIKGIAKYLFKTKNKNHIITSKIEHPSILNACKQLETEGFEVTYLSCDKKGKINLNNLKNSIKDNTALVSIMYVNNETGTENDIKSIFEICVDNDIYFHTDAVQSKNAPLFTELPLYCHSFSLSGHKLGALQGIGLLYIDNDIKLEPQIVGGHQQNGFRAGTENVFGILSIMIALNSKLSSPIYRMYRLSHGKPVTERSDEEIYIKTLINYIKESKIANYTIITPKECFHNGILNIAFDNVEGESLVLAMDKENIYISNGSACNSGSIEPSHVLTAMGYSNKVAKNSVRISFDNEIYLKDDLQYIANTLVKCVNNIRRINGD